MMIKEPIKPMWEDEYNKNWGKISIQLRKDYTTIIWEEMIFALIGGILPKEMKEEEINGIVVTSIGKNLIHYKYILNMQNHYTPNVHQ